jgi:hypothetical protein
MRGRHQPAAPHDVDGDELEIDDEALEVAAGGLIAPSKGSGGYSYNSTIYFQASISDPVT